MKYVIVAIGAGLGGGLRYWISSYMLKVFPIFFPFGTLAVNILGSIVIGILFFGFYESEYLSTYTKLFIGVGFCGGLTTFSAFSLETFNLLKHAEFLLAGFNIFANVFLTIFGIYIGYLITR